MEQGGAFERYDILLLNKDGTTKVFPRPLSSSAVSHVGRP